MNYIGLDQSRFSGHRFYRPPQGMEIVIPDAFIYDLLTTKKHPEGLLSKSVAWLRRYSNIVHVGHSWFHIAMREDVPSKTSRSFINRNATRLLRQCMNDYSSDYRDRAGEIRAYLKNDPYAQNRHTFFRMIDQHQAEAMHLNPGVAKKTFWRA